MPSDRNGDGRIDIKDVFYGEPTAEASLRAVIASAQNDLGSIAGGTLDSGDPANEVFDAVVYLAGKRDATRIPQTDIDVMYNAIQSLSFTAADQALIEPLLVNGEISFDQLRRGLERAAGPL